MKKGKGSFMGVLSFVTSIVIVLLFVYLTTTNEIYGRIDVIGGSIYVFLLAMIVSLSIWSEVEEWRART